MLVVAVSEDELRGRDIRISGLSICRLLRFKVLCEMDFVMRKVVAVVYCHCRCHCVLIFGTVYCILIDLIVAVCMNYGR